MAEMRDKMIETENDTIRRRRVICRGGWDENRMRTNQNEREMPREHEK
jgi:hypothetical protein